MNDIDTILIFWERNGEYGLKLTDGLTPPQFVEQPAGEMNHPAWVLSHLTTYHRVIDVIIQGLPLQDPADEEFGMKSKPEPDPDRYAKPGELRELFEAGHRQIADRIREQGPAVFNQPLPLERWRTWLPTTSAVIANLMVWHETLHLGQLSSWRRAMGLEPVSFLPIPTSK
ncbi:MAG: DinB family protein [Planctomycetota bacterium]